ncbi:MAG TPA: peptidase inhibitor family I36 protein [Kribbella sp.]|nr:peptidase inhibitor family I36 protein [Kribbella sp.]
MQKRVRRSAQAATVAAVLVAGAVVVPSQAAASTAGYETCPYGKVCLYEGWNGTGARWDVPGCGNWDVPAWMQNLGVSSVRTYGNAVWLSIKVDLTLGYVNRWTSTNLSAKENDKVFAVDVVC